MTGLGVLFSPKVQAALRNQAEKVPSTIEGEITALVSTLDDLPLLSSDPQALLGLMQEYFTEVQRAVFARDGMLQKHTPGGFLAIWGAPFRQRDSAERALDVAVALQGAIQKLGLRWGRRGLAAPSLHVGISTGLAAMGRVGDGGQALLTSVGAPIDQASRLSALAGRNEIVIAESTKAHLRHLTFSTRELPPLRWQRGEEPIELFNVLWQTSDQVVTEKTPGVPHVRHLIGSKK